MSTVTRVDHEVHIEEEDAPKGNAKPRWVGCTYHNGNKIYGKSGHGAHPGLVVSVSQQNQIVWSGPEPFEIVVYLEAGKPGSGKPFHRPKGVWKATQGTDKMWRVASGPATKDEFKGRPPVPVEYKFAAYALDAKGSRKKDSEELDPHIVVEP